MIEKMEEERKNSEGMDPELHKAMEQMKILRGKLKDVKEHLRDVLTRLRNVFLQANLKTEVES